MTDWRHELAGTAALCTIPTIRRQQVIPTEYISSFRTALFSGGYNLLFGAGISLSSLNSSGQPLLSTEALRVRLCEAKTVRSTTPLSRVYGLLTDEEVETYIIRPFSNCIAAGDLYPLARYLWLRMFTLNIDDVIENLYETLPDSKQALVPINYDHPLDPTPAKENVHLVHLHGSTRQPSSKFVFSTNDYAQQMRGLNPWMHFLASVIATEPFIIAGTSLDEVDFEFYVNKRTVSTPKRGTAPSLLIEPYPDASTVEACRRHGLLLVTATFAQFLAWVEANFPHPPTVSQLVVPNTGKLFPPSVTSSQLVRLFTDFNLFKAGNKRRSALPTPFLYGQVPSQDDLDEHVDIPRAEVAQIQDAVEARLRHHDGGHLVLVLDGPGTGKSSVLRRVAHNLTSLGHPVLEARTLSRIDANLLISCLAPSIAPIVVIVDNLADHVEQVRELLSSSEARGKYVIVGADRLYRREHIQNILGEFDTVVVSLAQLSRAERQQLIERYRQYGLVGKRQALDNPNGYADTLAGDPIAVAACRILDDFKPLSRIVDSLLQESTSEITYPYIVAAIARQCHHRGIAYSVLQATVGPKMPISDLFTDDVPLRLVDHPGNPAYCVPLNTSISESVLNAVADREEDMVYQAFVDLADQLAAHVSRHTIKRRTPEASLTGRLFDVDGITKPLLGPRTIQFFVHCQEQWQWNSRYWEQRALLIASDNIELAAKYARHAVAIDRHPFTLTTLSKILFMMDERERFRSSSAFDEAINLLTEAISRENASSRIAIHPYHLLLDGVVKRLAAGADISLSQFANLKSLLPEAKRRFGNDPQINMSLQRVCKLLDLPPI